MTPVALFLFLAAVFAGLVALQTVTRIRGARLTVSTTAIFCLTVIAGFFAWRSHRAIRQLQSLIDVPPYDQTIYVPNQQEVHSIAAVLGAVPVMSYPFSREQAQQIKRDLLSQHASADYWILKTAAKPAAIRDFYKMTSHRRDWEIVEESNTHFALRRNQSRLMIFFLDDFPRPQTSIVYVLSPT